MAGRGYIESDIDPLIERLLDADWINEKKKNNSRAKKSDNEYI